MCGKKNRCACVCSEFHRKEFETARWIVAGIHDKRYRTGGNTPMCDLGLVKPRELHYNARRVAMPRSECLKRRVP